jgi:hypothetical protein
MKTATRGFLKIITVAGVLALATLPAAAEQELQFRTPVPASSGPNAFVILKPGGVQNVQSCATQNLLDQLNLWPGQPVMVEYTWKAVGSSLPNTGWAGQKESLPLKSQLVIPISQEKKLCTAPVNVKYDAFPSVGMWEVAVSMHAPVKKYNSQTMLIGGGLARIRVDGPAAKANQPPSNVKAAPVLPPQPPKGEASSDQGAGQSNTRVPAVQQQQPKR